MTANGNHRDTAAEAVVKERSGISVIWLLPIVAVLIGGFVVYKTLSERGPEITITFNNAQGIEAGKTRIKYKELEIGTVTSVRLSRDFSHVIIGAELAPEIKPLLRRETSFWVVRPRLSLRGVSGLSTLVSGAYLEMSPGAGSPEREFVGLETPPVVKGAKGGKRIVLLSERLGSIDSGSPIYYQGIPAGEVTGYELGNDRKSVFIHAFIQAPYDEMVRGNTRFWNVSGIDVSIDSEGINIRTESVHSILLGGIAFETPDTLEPVQQDITDLVFTLHPNKAEIEKQSYTQKAHFVAFFDGSVRGLKTGAPVEFRGIRVGSVADLRLLFDRETTTFRIPVLLEIEPERVAQKGMAGVASPYESLKLLIERGLRARLETGSLITGQLFVDLDLYPESPLNLVGEGGPYPELPTLPASMEEMTASLTEFLGKLRKVPIDSIAQELKNTLEAANRTIGAPEVMGSIRNLEATLASLQKVTDELGPKAGPIADNVERSTAAAIEALEQLQKTLGLVNDTLSPDQPLHYGLIEMVGELSETARAIRSLVNQLEQNPESFLFGKGGGNK